MPRTKLNSLTTLTIANKQGKEDIKFMGMQGPRSFSKNLPKIKEGPEL